MTDAEGKKRKKADVHAACDKDDAEYFGAIDVIKAEQEYLRARRVKKESDTLAGLSLSGGGIRSASFSLGVMQALAHHGWLKKIDYLSTVSGGGYIGSSLTWLLSREWPLGRGGVGGPAVISFDTERNFPYATYPMSGEAPQDEERTPLSAGRGVRLKGRLLHFLRQNAKFLTPGRGVNIFSLIAVVLRGSLVSLAVYLGLLTLLFVGFHKADFFRPSGMLSQLPGILNQNLFLSLAIAGSLLFILSAPIYALGTLAFSRTFDHVHSLAYPMRRCYERAAGYALPFLLALAVLGVVPDVHSWILSQSDKVSSPAKFVLTGTPSKNGALTLSGEIDFNADNRSARIASPEPAPGPAEGQGGPMNFAELLWAQLQAFGAGLFTLMLGVASGIAAFLRTGRVKPGRIPMGLFVSVGVAMLLFGLVLLAYSLSLSVELSGLSLAWIAAGALAILALAFANINHLSIHRYYRDRLMETFMPDVAAVMADRYERSHVSSGADTGALHAMCHRSKRPEERSPYPGPYHIINANVILVSSEDAKFRGRGGDNFILSPAYCGSAATGWRRTEDYMSGTMTLASAMAISGAAVNPSTGSGGEGVTRRPFLSILMGLLNVRLGYWAPNPDPQPDPRLRTDLLGLRVPNYLLPGLWEIAWRNRLNEKGLFLQLSDGGHFENLALYELIRRKLPVIIVCDGGADPDFTFGDLANAMEKVRTDFGAIVMIESNDLRDLVPGQKTCGVKTARTPYLMATIKYADNSRGRLIYLTTTFCQGLSADLYGYKKDHPSFPDEPTSNQFFDEKQFEAYRELGFQAAWKMMTDAAISEDPIVKSALG